MNIFAELIVRFGGKIYLQLAEHVSSVSCNNTEEYLENITAFRNKQCGLIFAFRHNSKADAPVLTYVFGQNFPRVHRNVSKGRPKYFWVNFLHGDAVLDWAGAGARWLFPKIGALPVSNETLVRSQIDAIRKVMKDQSAPLCLAPEGQVNYYNHQSGLVTNGLSHFIRWEMSVHQHVRVQPINIMYHYKNPLRIVDKALADISRLFADAPSFATTSLAAKDSTQQGDLQHSADTLYAAGLALMDFIIKYLDPSDERTDIASASDRQKLEKIRILIFESAKEHYNVPDQGDWLVKLFKYRNDIFDELRASEYDVPSINKAIEERWKSPESMSPFMKQYQYQQIMDVLHNFNPEYANESSPGQSGIDENRLAEQALFLIDIINRIKGGDVNTRYFPKHSHAQVHFEKTMHFRSKDEIPGWKNEWISRYSGSMKEVYET